MQIHSPGQEATNKSIYFHLECNEVCWLTNVVVHIKGQSILLQNIQQNSTPGTRLLGSGQCRSHTPPLSPHPPFIQPLFINLLPSGQIVCVCVCVCMWGGGFNLPLNPHLTLTLGQRKIYTSFCHSAHYFVSFTLSYFHFGDSPSARVPTSGDINYLNQVICPFLSPPALTKSSANLLADLPGLPFGMIRLLSTCRVTWKL